MNPTKVEARKPAVKDVIMSYLMECKIRKIEPDCMESVRLVTEKVGADEVYVSKFSTHFPWYCSKFREHFRFIQQYKELEKTIKAEKN